MIQITLDNIQILYKKSKCKQLKKKVNFAISNNNIEAIII